MITRVTYDGRVNYVMLNDNDMTTKYHPTNSPPSDKQILMWCHRDIGSVNTSCQAWQIERRGDNKKNRLSDLSSSKNPRVGYYVKIKYNSLNHPMFWPIRSQWKRTNCRSTKNSKQPMRWFWLSSWSVSVSLIRLSGRVLLTRTLNLYYISAFSRSRWCLPVCRDWKCSILIGCHMQGNQCHFLAFYISRRRRHWHKSEHAQTDCIMF